MLLINKGILTIQLSYPTVTCSTTQHTRWHYCPNILLHTIFTRWRHTLLDWLY